MQNGCFPCKIAFLWKEVCYKVSLCKNRQQQSCDAFIGLSIHAEIVGGGRPLEGKCSCWSEPPVSATANTSHANKQWNTMRISFAL